MNSLGTHLAASFHFSMVVGDATFFTFPSSFFTSVSSSCSTSRLDFLEHRPVLVDLRSSQHLDSDRFQTSVTLDDDLDFTTNLLNLDSSSGRTSAVRDNCSRSDDLLSWRLNLSSLLSRDLGTRGSSRDLRRRRHLKLPELSLWEFDDEDADATLFDGSRQSINSSSRSQPRNPTVRIDDARHTRATCKKKQTFHSTKLFTSKSTDGFNWRELGVFLNH